ncbi:MAG: SMP-30/gluconolactonase/LRE family protein [Planctomycetota bacterium]
MPRIHDATPLHVPDTDALRFLPEGPIAMDHTGRVSWVGIAHGSDVEHGSINVLDLETMANVSYLLPGRPGFAFPCRESGKFVLGMERELGIFDLKTEMWSPFCDGVDQDVTGTIINDGMIYEDNLIFGTKDLEFATKKAGLYLYRGRDAKLIRLRDDQICSNGKSIRVNESGVLSLIDIDSPTRLIVEYPIDIDSATLGSPRTLVDLTSDAAVPDGHVLVPGDRDIIVSMFLPNVADYGQTRRFDLATGDCTEIWQTSGSPQNTCPCLVTHGGSVKLVITTAVENMSASDQDKCPNAGQLFVAPTDFETSGDLVTW